MLEQSPGYDFATITTVRKMLAQRGYVPIPCEGKRPLQKDWQKRQIPTAEEIGLWPKTYNYATNTGVLTRQTPVIDIDVADPDLADGLEHLLEDMFGERGKFITRIGNAPKRAIPFQTDAPFAKLTLNLVAPNGDTVQKIEALGDGQQCIVAGVHPTTKQLYRWTHGALWTVERHELPLLHAEDVAEFFARAVAEVITPAGWKVKEDPGKSKGETADGPQPRADWVTLTANILAGTDMHDSITRLAASMVAEGASDQLVIRQLQALMQAASGPHDDRWRERYDEIPRAVSSARAKFGEPAQAVEPLQFYFAENLEQKPVEPVDWVVRDFIPTGGVTGFFGDGGTGKDKLLLQLATAMTCGERWLGLDVKQGRVIYVPVEDDDRELNRRRDAIAAHYNGLRFADHPGQLMIIPLAGKQTVLAVVDYKSGLVRPTPQFEQLRKLVGEFRPALVIVGNRVNSFGVNQNEDSHARQCVQLLAGIAIEFDTAVVMPGHVSLAGLASGTGTSGSVQWSNACRSRLYLSRVVAADGGKDYELDPDVRLLETKKANWGPTGKKITLRWSSGVFVPDTGAVWSPGEVSALIEAEIEFLRMLDLIKYWVSPAPTAPNNAPKVFSQDTRCKFRGQRGKLALKSAMERLLTKGTIKLDEFITDSKPRIRIVRAFPEGQPEAQDA